MHSLGYAAKLVIFNEVAHRVVSLRVQCVATWGLQVTHLGRVYRLGNEISLCCAHS